MIWSRPFFTPSKPSNALVSNEEFLQVYLKEVNVVAKRSEKGAEAFDIISICFLFLLFLD